MRTITLCLSVLSLAAACHAVDYDEIRKVMHRRETQNSAGSLSTELTIRSSQSHVPAKGEKQVPQISLDKSSARTFAWKDDTWSWVETTPSDREYGIAVFACDGKFYSAYPIRANSQLQAIGHGIVGRENAEPFTPLSFGYSHEGVPWSDRFSSMHLRTLRQLNTADFGKITRLSFTDAAGYAYTVDLLDSRGYFPVVIKQSITLGTTSDSIEWRITKLNQSVEHPFAREATYKRLLKNDGQIVEDQEVRMVAGSLKAGREAEPPRLSFPSGLKLYDHSDPKAMKAVRADEKGELHEIPLLEGTIAYSEEQRRRMAILYGCAGAGLVLLLGTILGFRLKIFSAKRRTDSLT
jgi:hypothetical protein